MKSIKTTLKKWMDENKSFRERYAVMKAEILHHPHIVDFLKQHPDITDEAVHRQLNKLHEYITQSKQCEYCSSYEACQNIVKGYTPHLLWENGDIHVAYEKCEQHLRYEDRVEKSTLVKSLYIPKDILEAKIADIHYDSHRKKAFFETNKFLDDAQNFLPSKGLFFSGPFGVGKTFFIGAIANRLRELNYSSALIYMPEFVHEMREAIKHNTVQEKMDIFKHTDVLMFDDIGAETLSAWFRDEVLGSILQHRMNEKLPVFFTSNYSMDQLESVLATTTKGDVEKVKAGRIMERIRQVSIEVPLSGHNRRSE